MIYIWCMALTVGMICTAGPLIDTYQRLTAAELKMQVRILRSREYGTRTTK